MTYVTNEVTAEIGKNVLVNQPNPNPSSNNPIVPDETQSVTVTAELTAKVVEVGQQAAFSFNLDGQADAGEKLFFERLRKCAQRPGRSLWRERQKSHWRRDVAEHRRQRGDGQGTSRTTPKSRPRTASASRPERLSNVSVVQTGTASTDFGFTAAINVGVFDLKTIASIDQTVEITTRHLAVNAEDESDRIAITGGFLKGEQVGIGTWIGVNVITQHVMLMNPLQIPRVRLL